MSVHVKRSVNDGCMQLKDFLYSCWRFRGSLFSQSVDFSEWFLIAKTTNIEVTDTKVVLLYSF